VAGSGRKEANTQCWRVNPPPKNDSSKKMWRAMIREREVTLKEEEEKNSKAAFS